MLTSLLVAAWRTLSARRSLIVYLAWTLGSWFLLAVILLYWVFPDLLALVQSFRISTTLDANILVRMKDELISSLLVAIPLIVFVLLMSIQAMLMLIHRLGVLEVMRDETVWASLMRTKKDFLPAVVLSIILGGLIWLLHLLISPLHTLWGPWIGLGFLGLELAVILSLLSFSFWFLLAKKDAIGPAVIGSVRLCVQRFSAVLQGLGIVLLGHVVVLALFGIPVLLGHYVHWGFGVVFGLGIAGLYALVLTYLFVFWGKLFYHLSTS